MCEAEKGRGNRLLTQPAVHNATYFLRQIQPPTSVSYYKTKIIFIAGYDFSFFIYALLFMSQAINVNKHVTK
jgi:hypothetical protein